MGFFNTQPRDDGSAQFTISGNWWWYIAISVPVTIALWLYMVGYRYYNRHRSGVTVIPDVRRGSRDTDVEAQEVLTKKDS